MPIEEVVVGQRVMTSPEAEQRSDTQVDPKFWRVYRLKINAPPAVYEVELLRSADWLTKQNAKIGDTVPFQIEEMGIDSDAVVLGIEPCPEISSGRGRVVLMTITHVNPNVLTLTFDEEGLPGRSGEARSLEPTIAHSFYSETRNGWIPAGELAAGEVLRTRNGTRTIAAITAKSGEHRVYNLEVETDHVYYVGPSQVLVHNSCKKNTVKCFPAGTLVLMADGSIKPIEAIEKGEYVSARNPEKNGVVDQFRVLDTLKNYTYCFVSILVDNDGDAVADAVFRATREHPFWTKNENWKNATDLIKGDVLEDAEGNSSVVLNTFEEEVEADTFNLTVAGVHTFYVVENGVSVLVHNTGDDDEKYWNYHLEDSKGETYYHGMSSQDPAAVEARHAKNNNRFDPGNGDRLVQEPGKRGKKGARVMEDTNIRKDGTNIGRDGKNYRGNRQNGISDSPKQQAKYYGKDPC